MSGDVVVSLMHGALTSAPSRPPGPEWRPCPSLEARKCFTTVPRCPDSSGGHSLPKEARTATVLSGGGWRLGASSTWIGGAIPTEWTREGGRQDGRDVGAGPAGLAPDLLCGDLELLISLAFCCTCPASGYEGEAS